MKKNKYTKKQLREINESFLSQFKFDNKTQVKVLLKYNDELYIRIVIMFFAFLSFIASPSMYVFFSAFTLILFEAFIYRYYVYLKNKFKIKKDKNGVFYNI